MHARKALVLLLQHVALGFPYNPQHLTSPFLASLSYKGWLNYLPSLCTLALAASIHLQDLSANGEAAVDAKLVVREVGRKSTNCHSVGFFSLCIVRSTWGLISAEDLQPLALGGTRGVVLCSCSRMTDGLMRM